MLIDFLIGVKALIMSAAMWVGGRVGLSLGDQLRHFAVTSEYSLSWIGIVAGGLLAVFGFYRGLKNVGLLTQSDNSGSLSRLLLPWKLYLFSMLCGFGMGLFFWFSMTCGSYLIDIALTEF